MQRCLFWSAYTAAFSAWLLAGFGMASALVGQRSMPAAMQLTLRGGQCQPNNGTCSSQCTTSPNDCKTGGVGVTGCKNVGDSCDTISCQTDGSGINNVCQQNQNATSSCILSLPQQLCINNTQCVCQWNMNSQSWYCDNGKKVPDDESVCISGAPGQPHGGGN